LIGYLLEKNGDIKIVNNKGETPIFYGKPEILRKYGFEKETVFNGNIQNLAENSTNISTKQQKSQEIDLKNEFCNTLLRTPLSLNNKKLKIIRSNETNKKLENSSSNTKIKINTEFI